jgi:hypothetical protein
VGLEGWERLAAIAGVMGRVDMMVGMGRPG